MPGSITHTTDRIRVCQLQEGDVFYYNSVWRRVHSVKDGRVYHYNIIEGKNKEDSLGAGSQQFVQIDEATMYRRRREQLKKAS